MPYGALERPALGISLLKSNLNERGVPCDVEYLTFAFAEFIGVGEYQWIQGELPHVAFAGDWTFAAALGEREGAAQEYVDTVLREQWQLDRSSIVRLTRIRAYAEHFLRHCLTAVPWERYDVVGFTSTFEQNVASLALAGRLKALRPETVVVFGGANWEGEMGIALHERLPFVDYVCSGEADESFPQLLARIGEGRDPDDVPGVVFRRGARTLSTGPAPLVRDLDRLPPPDFDDYVEALESSPAAISVTPLMLLETSRGCWWGAKRHCTFCGLNGGAMTYRSKTAELALAELRRLRDRYGATVVSVVDNILDMRYFKTLLPRIADENLELELFYEVKANLTREHVRLLAAAGVRNIQPGIESLSDDVLALMRKGTTALQNVQLLKWCREYGIRPDWNLLYGFPGEDPRDYAQMIPLIQSIRFLEPPGAHGSIRLDRFSPYHSDPRSFGMLRVRALPAYHYLYPFDDAALARVAYYFDFDYADGRKPLAYVQPVLDVVDDWRRTGPDGGFWAIGGPDDSLALVREEGGTLHEVTRLESWQATVYNACDEVQSPARLARQPELAHVPYDALLEFLRWCIDEGLMLERDGRALALAVHSPARAAPRGVVDAKAERV
jgi:ribosomal peptide maturation radical SAM protein 1